MMLDLSKSTEFNKKIPKNKFYKNLNLNSKIVDAFTKDVESIYWTNKISEDTLKVKKGKKVTEIEVFLLRAKGNKIDEAILKAIDQAIPYHIIFILEYRDRIDLVAAVKEAKTKTYFEVEKYFYKKITSTSYKLRLLGHDLDLIYENIIRDILGIEKNQGQSLRQDLERFYELEDLSKSRKALANKMKRTKQFNKKMQISDEIKAIDKKIQNITGDKNDN